MQNNNKQYQNELLSCMNFLQQQIEEIESLPDKSLFFQNPLIFEGWVSLIRALDKIEPFYVQEREQTTETYVLYLLSLRELKIKYKNLAENYYYQLKDLLECYAGWLIGDCISKEGMVALSTDQYEHDMDNVENLYQYLVSLNDNSNRARSAIYTVLTDVFNVLLVIMNRGGKIIRERFPNLNDFVKAINDDLRMYTKDFGEDMLREMNEDLNRHYKDCRTDPNTPALWGDMLTAYEQALKMAIKKELAKCDEPKQEHWDSHQPKDFLDDNSEMISRIYELCYTDKLIDFSDPENIQPFLNVLTSKNIELFYNLIVMRNLIQCEMYPNLKAQHEAWLKGNQENVADGEENSNGSATARKSKLEEIITILKNGNFKKPATAENIGLLLKIVFGEEQLLLEESDKTECDKMWALVESGGGANRQEIVSGNLAGFLRYENLLVGSPTDICKDIYGKSNKQLNNYINKGNPNNCSQAFKAVIPFLRKYIDKIIRKE